jgi:hypothetical protein
MAQTFYNILANGGGRVEFVFFIHGLPWAVSTHADVLTALPVDSINAQVRAYRKNMFGTGEVTIDANVTRSYNKIPIFDTLDANLGSQTVKFAEGKGLTGGNWSVNIAAEELGYSWNHRTGTIWGLEGLDVIPNDDADSSICVAQLATDLLASGGTLTYKNDIGGKLKTKIDAKIALDIPAYIWIGSEVVAAYAGSVDNGDGTFSVTVSRGHWKTKAKHAFTEDADSNNMLISDAPMGGIAGLPATLYAIPMDKDGTILDIADADGPARFREGRTMPSSMAQDGKRKVSVHFVKKWLDHDVHVQNHTAHLGGFTLSRQSATSVSQDQAAHMYISEWTGAVRATREIWLCAAGDTVHFDTYTQLLLATQEELSGPVHSDATSNWFLMDAGNGPTQVSCNGTNFPYLEGPLPRLLGWGGMTIDALGEHRLSMLDSKQEWNLADYCSMRLAVVGDDDIQGHTLSHGYDHAGTFANPFRAEYIHQYAWEDDDCADIGAWMEDENAKLQTLPIPLEDGDGTYRLYVAEEFDATDFANDAQITIGLPDRVDDYGETLLAKGGVLGTADNYIKAKGSSPGYNFSADDPDASHPAFSSQDELPGPWYRGFTLYHIPGLIQDNFKGQDPWPIRERVVIRSENPAKILRGLLGASTNVEAVPDKYEATHIPGFWDDSGNWKDGINWDQLEDLCAQAMESLGTYYEMSFDKKFNILRVYHELLKTHQLSETYEYNDTIKGWQIGFRRTGIVNITEAGNQGRVVDSSIRQAGNSPATLTADTWMFGRVNANMHWDDQQGKFLVQVPADDRSGRAMGGGSESEYKIEDKLTHFENAEEIATDPDLLDAFAQYFGALLKRLARAWPVQKVKCTLGAVARLAVGRECLVTDSSAKHPYTGALGLSRQPALVTAITTSVADRRADCGVSYVFSPNAVRGWAPALYIDAAEIAIDAGLVYDITMAHSTPATQNDFADPNGGLTDLQYFDCWMYNVSTDTVEAKPWCSCGNYAVQMFDTDVTTYDQATPGRNHWTGTIAVSAADTAVLTLANNDDFNAGTDKIMLFDSYDNCEACQQDYLFFADSNSQLGASNIVGGRWG